MILLLIPVQDFKNYVVLYKKTLNTIYYIYINRKKKKSICLIGCLEKNFIMSFLTDL